MKRDTIRFEPLVSSFLSCEKDTEEIIKKLFVTNQPYSNQLKRLLVINTKDCLENSNKDYEEIVKNTTIKDLIENQYLCLIPRIKMKEHEEVKSYVILSFGSFLPNATNPQFRDCTVTFSIICHKDYWDLGNYQLRPFKIAGVIDGILNETRLSGIGTLQFLGLTPLPVDENYAGYSLMYSAVHGSDDKIPWEE